MRFLEIYRRHPMKSIPIVESWHHTYRTKEESTINYKYILYRNIETVVDYDDINENTLLFEKHHLLK